MSKWQFFRQNGPALFSCRYWRNRNNTESLQPDYEDSRVCTPIMLNFRFNVSNLAFGGGEKVLFFRGHLDSYYHPRSQYADYLALRCREVSASAESFRVARPSKPRWIGCTSFELCRVACGAVFGVENRLARFQIRPDDTSNNNNRSYLDSFGRTPGGNRGSPKTNPLHSDVARYGAVLVRNDFAVMPGLPSIREIAIYQQLPMLALLDVAAQEVPPYRAYNSPSDDCVWRKRGGVKHHGKCNKGKRQITDEDHSERPFGRSI